LEPFDATEKPLKLVILEGFNGEAIVNVEGAEGGKIAFDG
jgi:hypothetical protein